MTIPGLAGGSVGTKYDWNFTYAPNPNLNNRAIPLGQGKVVGGGTKLNAMTFDRGSQSDYDTWEALGAKGWNCKSLLPYFKKVCSPRNIMSGCSNPHSRRRSPPRRLQSGLNTTLRWTLTTVVATVLFS